MLPYAPDEDTVATAAKVCEFIVGTGEGVHVHRKAIALCFTHASGAALADVVTHFARRTSRDRDALHTVVDTAEKHCVADLHVAGVGLVCAGLGAWWVATCWASVSFWQQPVPALCAACAVCANGWPSWDCCGCCWRGTAASFNKTQ